MTEIQKNRLNKLLNICVKMQKEVDGKILLILTSSMKSQMYEYYGKKTLNETGIYCITAEENQADTTDSLIVLSKTFDGIIALNISVYHMTVQFAAEHLNYNSKRNKGIYFKRMLFLFG